MTGQKKFNGWWEALSYPKNFTNLLYTIYPILACLNVLNNCGKLSAQKILRPVKSHICQHPNSTDQVNFESIYFSLLLHYIWDDHIWLSINKKCETVVHSLLNLTKLPEFLSDSDSAIYPTGNRNTFVTKQPSRLLQKEEDILLKRMKLSAGARC